EFFVKGIATGYRQVGTWGSDGRWTARPAETASYETRILVRRPADPARFNGTVVVEGLNLSFNIDGEPDFLYASQDVGPAVCARGTRGWASRPSNLGSRGHSG